MNAVLETLASWRRVYVQAVSQPKKPIVIPAPVCRMPCGGREYEPDELAKGEDVQPGCMWCVKWRACAESGYGPAA